MEADVNPFILLTIILLNGDHFCVHAHVYENDPVQEEG
jgi:hypothetical protein